MHCCGHVEHLARVCRGSVEGISPSHSLCQPRSLACLGPPLPLRLPPPLRLLSRSLVFHWGLLRCGSSPFSSFSGIRPGASEGNCALASGNCVVDFLVAPSGLGHTFDRFGFAIGLGHGVLRRQRSRRQRRFRISGNAPSFNVGLEARHLRNQSCPKCARQHLNQGRGTRSTWEE